MSNLPQSLEEMQRDILQYDLSKNKYLQPSTIPTLDKELKTKSKKIISAINELLNIINTFSTGIENFMRKMNDKYDECVKKIYEIESIGDGKISGGESVSMELKCKVKLDKGASQEIDMTAEELYDPKRQIKIYAYDEGSKKYKFIDYDLKMQTSGNSVYKFDVSPVELQIDEEGSEVILVNRSSWELIILLYSN